MLIAAVNFEDRLVLLEDGRELTITRYYSSGDRMVPLNAQSELCKHHRVETHEDADVFAAEFPGTNTFIIVEMKALALLDASKRH